MVGGSIATEGRVEVYHFGQWGTVCNSYWDLRDATVVCRQLGYLRAVGAPTYAARGAGSGPSWYSNVGCTGTEKNLTECSKSISLFGTACPYSDAGVLCSGESIFLQANVVRSMIMSVLQNLSIEVVGLSVYFHVRKKS